MKAGLLNNCAVTVAPVSAVPIYIESLCKVGVLWSCLNLEMSHVLVAFWKVKIWMQIPSWEGKQKDLSLSFYYIERTVTAALHCSTAKLDAVSPGCEECSVWGRSWCFAQTQVLGSWNHSDTPASDPTNILRSSWRETLEKVRWA